MPIGIYERKPEYLERLKKQGFKKGFNPWNKGKKTGIIPKTAFKKGYKMSKEAKRKMSESRIGHFVSEETKRKIRESKIGKKRPNFSGEKHPNWKNGKYKSSDGYILIYCPNHPFLKGNYIRESRFVIEKQIGRYLLPDEVTHHLGEKTDNRLKMLMAFVNQSTHMKFHKNPSNIKSKDIIFDGRLLI